MRTLIFLTAGFLILAAFILLARMFTMHYPAVIKWTILAYAVFWFGVTAFNMWVGIDKAGYSFAEELPIFLLLCGVPIATAAFLKWKVL